MFVFLMVPAGDYTMLVTLNHTLPLAVLFVDFWVNCVPFVPRHYFVFTMVLLIWAILVSLSKLDHPFENLWAWSEEEVGLLVPVLMIPCGWVLHLMLIYCNKKKMEFNNKAEALE